MLNWFVRAAPVRAKFMALAALQGAIYCTTVALTVGLTDDSLLSRDVLIIAASGLVILATTLIARNLICDPYVATVLRMEELAQGDLSSPVQFTDYEDCVGRMTKAMATFRDNARHVAESVRIEEETKREQQDVIEALDAALTATSLPDVAAAIINNDFVSDAGLSFEDAIAVDDPSDPNALPYVNIFAARAEDADNPTYLKLVEIYQNTQDVLDGVQEASGGTAVLLDTPAEDLVASLEDVEEDIRANQ